MRLLGAPWLQLRLLGPRGVQVDPSVLVHIPNVFRLFLASLFVCLLVTR